MVDQHCNYDPYYPALQAAVAFVLDRFDVRGIVVAGSVLRGEGHASSDLDLYVIQATPQRQRLQKVFHGVPVEIFVNPAEQVEHYFKSERSTGRPITAHMLATGFVVLDRDGVIVDLRQRARVMLNTPPNPTPERLRMMRYLLATQVEDAHDIAEQNVPGAAMILSLAVHGMLHYRFWQANRYLPRDKDLLQALHELDAPLSDLARAYYACTDPAERLVLADQIADHTIQTRGFFEWDSDLEPVPARSA